MVPIKPIFVASSLMLMLLAGLALFPSNGVAGSSSKPNTAPPSVAQTKPTSYKYVIGPMLIESCSGCHSKEAHSSGFVVDTPQSIFKGGTKYPGKAIVPGSSASSILVQYLRGSIKPSMPMAARPFTDKKISLIAAWIDAGATVEDARPAAALPGSGHGLVSFRESVEPFLKQNCSSCHSADAHKSGFVVESPDALLLGGTKFGAKDVVPGNSKQSRILMYLSGTLAPRMPLGGPAVDRSDLRNVQRWIDQGAQIDAQKLGWPYTPPSSSMVPRVSASRWVTNPIDNFILAKLESRKLAPAPRADRVTLLRRAFIDLVGELPTPSEADSFLRDNSSGAYPKLVDKLLADPRYGERWGRHWLDLVRYADSHGFEVDGVRPLAWRYRDWVIHAFNTDEPYNEFIKDQIAGDELHPQDPNATIATGYARLGPWDELSGDSAQRWQDYLNDVTDTTGSVVLGMTVGCARCHNHKYDQIKQSDYYRLQAFFVQTKWINADLPKSVGPTETQQRYASLRQVLDSAQNNLDTLEMKYRAATASLHTDQKTARSAGQINLDIQSYLSGPNKAKEKQAYENAAAVVSSLEASTAGISPSAEAICDGSGPVPQEHVLIRGNLHTPGPVVMPGFVASFVHGAETPAAVLPVAGGKSTGRRAALANWLGSESNPMTARVIVNRMWQFHFGKGIVGTPSDFGKNGDGPSHRELLDWLAVKFMRDGWSLKKMHRLMLLSSTYQQSAQSNSTSDHADPGNRLLSHMNRLRMDAETLRDSILCASGRLNQKMGGPGVFPKVSDEVLSTGSTHKWGSSSDADQLRRTVYVFQRRSLVLPIVEAFDGPDMNNSCPRRSVTTISPQALTLFNGDFGRTESQYFADRVIREMGNNPDAQIVHAYEIAFNKRPNVSEINLARTYLAKKRTLYSGDGSAAIPSAHVGVMTPIGSEAAEKHALADFCHVLINTNRFIYLD